MAIRHVTVDGLARLPAFCHAVVAGDFVYVSGTLGTAADGLELVDGGVAAQTTQALGHLERILHACGAALHNVVKVQVVLADLDDFAEMNAAYLAVFGSQVPARITIGAQLVMNAAVEIDCVAYLGE
jgi:2-iminobutanoate/2-iminopropanoate deaminase